MYSVLHTNFLYDFHGCFSFLSELFWIEQLECLESQWCLLSFVVKCHNSWFETTRLGCGFKDFVYRGQELLLFEKINFSLAEIETCCFVWFHIPPVVEATVAWNIPHSGASSKSSSPNPTNPWPDFCFSHFSWVPCIFVLSVVWCQKKKRLENFNWFWV